LQIAPNQEVSQALMLLVCWYQRFCLDTFLLSHTPYEVFRLKMHWRTCNEAVYM